MIQMKLSSSMIFFLSFQFCLCGRGKFEISQSIDHDINSVDDGNVKSFEEMGLREEILRNINFFTVLKPTDLQQQAIVPIIKGSDVIIKVPPGSGKSDTISISIVQKINLELKECQALILVPSKQLAQKLQRRVSLFSNNLNIKSYTLSNGPDIQTDIRKLSDGPQIVIGTPKSVLDFIKNGALSTKYIKMFVLDDTDKLLSLGFIEPIYNIIRNLNSNIQVISLSTSMPIEVLNIANKFMRDPIYIQAKKTPFTLENIKQYYIKVYYEVWKIETLTDLMETLTITQSIIYCNTKEKVEWIASILHKKDFTVSAVHDGMDKSQRDLILKNFFSGGNRYLITTDIINNNIKAQRISLVINYDLPKDNETYMLRIGHAENLKIERLAINFITDSDNRMMRNIEAFYHTKISELPENVEELI